MIERQPTPQPVPPLSLSDRLTMPAGARTVLTLDEAAESLTICRNKVIELLDTGALRAIYIGRRRVIPVRALHEFITDQMERQGQV